MACLACVMVSSGRKGTFLVQTALRGHPHVEAYEQLLVKPNYLPTASGHEVLGRLFDRVAPDVKAAVLPIAWNTARTRYAGFWEELRERGVHVVLLKRRNMLRWYLSYRVAYATNVWSTDQQSAEPLPRIRIDPDACIESILRDRADEEAAAAYFVDHPRMEIVYEDLVPAFDVHMDRLQRFLRVEPLRLRPTAVKQERRPLTAAIENFDELRSVWKGTQWEHMLEPDAETGVESTAVWEA